METTITTELSRSNNGTNIESIVTILSDGRIRLSENGTIYYLGVWIPKEKPSDFYTGNIDDETYAVANGFSGAGYIISWDSPTTNQENSGTISPTGPGPTKSLSYDYTFSVSNLLANGIHTATWAITVKNFANTENRTITLSIGAGA